jgi:hypothetical protein
MRCAQLLKDELTEKLIEVLVRPGLYADRVKGFTFDCQR